MMTMRPPDAALAVVAQGEPALLDAIRVALGPLPGLRIIEDRRRDRTLLPREGREGRVYVPA
jgi:hypothetical protein